MLSCFYPFCFPSPYSSPCLHSLYPNPANQDDTSFKGLSLNFLQHNHLSTIQSSTAPDAFLITLVTCLLHGGDININTDHNLVLCTPNKFHIDGISHLCCIPLYFSCHAFKFRYRLCSLLLSVLNQQGLVFLNTGLIKCYQSPYIAHVIFKEPQIPEHCFQLVTSCLLHLTHCFLQS